MYQKVNEGRKPFKPRLTACRDKDGALLSDEGRILQRWRQYFQELLGDKEALEESSSQPAPIEDLNPPDEEEIIAAVGKLKNNKAPGYDGLTAELFKHGGQELIKALQDLLMAIWNEETMPRNWRRTIICPIHKKGDQLDCSNYRGISLLPVAYKILSLILFDRLQPHAERIVGTYQAGFRRGRSTVDQIFTLRQILEKGREYNVQTHHLFVDFESAYDSIDRQKLYQAMEELGVPMKLVRMCQVTMEGVECFVRVQAGLSDPLIPDKGVRQGDALACLLFNIGLEKAVRDSGIQMHSTIFNMTAQLLGYADDLDVMGRSFQATAEAFLSLSAAAMRVGLRVNAAKTKYLVTGQYAEVGEQVEIGPYKFDRVNDFTYLGCLVNCNNETSHEIRCRITKSSRCFFGLRHHMRNKSLSRTTKIHLYKTLIRPVLTYGSETWTLTKADELALQVHERKMLRSIYGGVVRDDQWCRRTNNELYSLYTEPEISRFVRLGRLRWAGHLARMDENEVAKKVFLDQIYGTRRKGRPRLRWQDGVAHDARTILGVRNWKAAALDRDTWRKLIQEAQTQR